MTAKNHEIKFTILSHYKLIEPTININAIPETRCLLTKAHLLISVYQHNTEWCRLQFTTGADYLYIVTFTDIVDMYRYRGISSNAVLLHQTYKFTFCQVVWW